MSDDASEPEQPAQPEIIIEPNHMAGVWANVASISQTPHEFTLDFIRLDATAAAPGRGIVVARVAFSPLMAGQLTDLLNGAWQRYAQIPDTVEVSDDEEEHTEG